jgi:hypothetical protein
MRGQMSFFITLVSARQGWTLERLPGYAPGPLAVAAARKFERKPK